MGGCRAERVNGVLDLMCLNIDANNGDESLKGILADILKWSLDSMTEPSQSHFRSNQNLTEKIFDRLMKLCNAAELPDMRWKACQTILTNSQLPDRTLCWVIENIVNMTNEDNVDMVREKWQVFKRFQTDWRY